jgi:hypothetical protein
MNSSMIRVIGILFLICGFFIDDIVDSFTLVNEIEVVRLGLPQPSEEISSAVTAIDDIVTEPEDRLALAIFNKVCAERILNWPEFNQQQWNDAYVFAAKKFFGNSIQGKYESLNTFIVSIISEVTGEDIVNLSAGQKKEIIDRLNGIAWTLAK